MDRCKYQVNHVDYGTTPVVNTSTCAANIEGTIRLLYVRAITIPTASKPGSINGGILEGVCSLSYVGVEEAAKGILMFGQDAMVAKVDIHSAYRNIPIHPEDIDTS